MSNYTPIPIGSLSNQTAAIAAINENFQDIADSLESKLNRDGSLPNQMEADLDMNSNDILNVGTLQARSILLDDPSIVTTEVVRNVRSFTATAGQSSYTPSPTPVSASNIDVYVNGLSLSPGTDYVFSGGTITFVPALVGGEDVVVKYDNGASFKSAATFDYDPAAGVTRTVQEKLRESVSIADFGGVGNDTFDNITAFASAQASTAERIYLPEGTYYTSGAASLLTKHYYGPGKIRTAGGDRTPGRFTWMTSRPFEGTGLSYAKFFSADLSATDAAYQICSANRTSLTEPYFAPETSHQLKLFDNRAGSSGTTARLTAIAGLGATSATLNSAAGLSIGSVIGFNDGNDNITNIRTLTNVVGNVISWATPLTSPAPYAVGSRITLGRRTMQSMAHLELQHRGAGDGYIHLMRVEASYAGTAGQDHPFFRSTAGFDGGDIVATSPNVYLTGREITFDDNGNDIYVISEIRTFNRLNSTAALQQVWHGQTMNSSGTQWCEVAYIAAGKWKALFDSSRMDSSVNGGCVGNMANDQYFYWGSTGDSAQLYESWGRNRGTPRMGYSSGRAAFALDGAPITGDTLHVAPAVASDPTIGVIASGVYTPTLFNTTNVAASSAVECQWMRVGRVVTVSGQVTIDPTAASVLTELGLSLPIASALVGARQVAGTACSEEAAGLFARVRGDATNDRAVICFNVADIASRGWSFTFTYLVV